VFHLLPALLGALGKFAFFDRAENTLNSPDLTPYTAQIMARKFRRSTGLAIASVVAVGLGVTAVATRNSDEDSGASTTTLAVSVGTVALGPPGRIEQPRATSREVKSTLTGVEPGAFVVVFADDGGNQGALLGASEVVAGGDTRQVTAPIPTQVAGTSVWLVLHADVNDNGVLDFPGVDVPAENQFGITVIQAKVEQ
jgi:hypothetical protein